MRLRITLSVAALCAATVLGSAALASGQEEGGPEPLFAELSGANELTPQGQRGAGDDNGRGSFSLTFDGGKICFGLTVANIGKPLAAHIHKGGPKVSGDIVVDLKNYPAGGNPGASSGCVSARRALRRAIQRHPGRYYVNVHTKAYPAGAIRGQLAAEEY